MRKGTLIAAGIGFGLVMYLVLITADYSLVVAIAARIYDHRGISRETAGRLSFAATWLVHLGWFILASAAWIPFWLALLSKSDTDRDS
jgi:hypothetical protein